MFSTVEQRIESAALDLVYHLTPWDRPVLGANSAAIAAIRIGAEVDAARHFEVFRDWCAASDVRLVSCRLPQSQLAECGFLERLGFRFIELNYRPILRGLGGFADDQNIRIRTATQTDAADLSAIAERTFEAGRLHVDPEIGPEIGNRRYAAWVANAFRHPGQQVLKCLMDDVIVAFMVVERPMPALRFWSLVSLAPGLAGKGLGGRVWRAMLAFHQREGVEEVSTSISSHNTAAFNLYVSLGFRFPPPTITMHWCPAGPLLAVAA